MGVAGHQTGPERPGRKYGAALEELGGHHGREEHPMVHLPHGGDWQPSGRLGAALGSWAAARVTPIKDAAPPYVSIGRGAKYIWIIT